MKNFISALKEQARSGNTVEVYVRVKSPLGGRAYSQNEAYVTGAALLSCETEEEVDEVLNRLVLLPTKG